MGAQIEKSKALLQRILNLHKQGTCQHENTHRGGIIWEICDDCGEKWADDQGGKPKWQDPPEWAEAQAFIDSLGQPESDPVPGWINALPSERVSSPASPLPADVAGHIAETQHVSYETVQLIARQVSMTINLPNTAKAVSERMIDPGVVVSFAVDRWLAEVSNRPLVNVHRRTLDDTWRQVIRKFGGDPDDLLGPSHDALLAGAKPKT